MIQEKKLVVKLDEVFELSTQTFSQLKEEIASKEITEVSPQLKKLLKIREKMEKSKKDFLKSLEIEFAEFDANFRELDNYIENDLKLRALEYAEKNAIRNNKINVSTGELTTKVNSGLPKGFVYSDGKWIVEYKEDLIPDNYFKKVLEKTKVKKAVEDGQLPIDVLSYSKSDPSISFRVNDLASEENENL